MDYLWFKALHIIFVVTWFAGLFYIVRLFIYQREAQDKSPEERQILTIQFKLMSKRLWLGITWPSALITLIFGATLLFQVPAYFSQPWMHIKLTLVFFLYMYHFVCHRIFSLQQKDVYNWSSNRLRIWNEVATLFLFAIVFLVVLKTTTGWLKGIAGLVLLAVAMLVGIKMYRKKRLRKESKLS